VKTGEAVHKVKRRWSVRVPSSPRLEKPAIRGPEHESSTKTGGSRCKTLLSLAAPLLEPRHSTVSDKCALLAAKAMQEHYYNAHSRPLPDLTTGRSVRLRLPGENLGPWNLRWRRRRQVIRYPCWCDFISSKSSSHQTYPQLNKDLAMPTSLRCVRKNQHTAVQSICIQRISDFVTMSVDIANLRELSILNINSEY